MAGPRTGLLDPLIISRLGSLDLIARTLVEGFLVGLHRSPYHGFSVEFAEYRQYIPGEPTAHIDWRVYAKTDRHYIRVFHQETNLHARLLLDVSASMAQAAHGGKDHLTKLEYAKLLTAALCYLLIKQNDATGLVTFDRRPLQIVPPRSSRRQLMHLLSLLERVQPGEQTDVGEVLGTLAERMWRRGLVVVISDLIDDPDRVLTGLKHFRHREHEVIVFHVLDPREVDLRFSQEARFIDPEQQLDPIRAQPWHLREAYVAEVEAWRGRLARECQQHQIDYVPLTTDTAFDRALLAYLNKRAKLG